MPTDAGGAGAAVAPVVAALEQAHARCERIAREHYENFPVASRLLSREARRALTAVYAFARQADDFADEGHGPDGPTREQRLAALDDWEARLHAACGLADEVPGDRTGERARRHEAIAAPHGDAIFLALSDIVERHRLPVRLFEDLISAFRQDVLVAEYTSRSDLLDYCRRSANPVGRLVLTVHGFHEEAGFELSDAICTGLQLANFWQDVAIDRRKGRIYLPREDRERAGVVPEDLDRPTATENLRRLVLEEADWARSFFERGRPLVLAAPGRLRVHLKLVWLGGVRVLDRIEEAGGDTLVERPKLGRLDWARILIQAALPVGAP
jgi:squalene synthase HpnC